MSSSSDHHSDKIPTREIFDLPRISTGKYEAPSLPLQVQYGPRSGAIQIPESEREILEQFASWEQNPPFEQYGRSAHMQRQTPLKIGSDTIYGYKLKGVGNFDPKTEKISPPRGDSYQAKTGTRDLFGNVVNEKPVILIHQGISDDGSFRPILDPKKPVGGLASGRGQREFENAVKLHDAGVLACLPIEWGRYPSVMWEGQPTEFVILGLPGEDKQRLTEYFEPSPDRGRWGIGKAMHQLLSTRCNVQNESEKTQVLLISVAEMAMNIGKLLRKAHTQAGVARFASHLGNFSFAPDMRGVILHDLDSSVSLRDLSPTAQSLTIIRDIESAIFGFLHSIAHANILYIAENQDMFTHYNLFQSLLQGYFGGDVDSAAIQHAGRSVMAMFLELMKGRGLNPSADQQQMWLAIAGHNMPPHAMKEVFSLYEKSSLNQKIPLPYKKPKLEENIARYQQQMGEVYIREAAKLSSSR